MQNLQKCSIDSSPKVLNLAEAMEHSLLMIFSCCKSSKALLTWSASWQAKGPILVELMVIYTLREEGSDFLLDLVFDIQQVQTCLKTRLIIKNFGELRLIILNQMTSYWVKVMIALYMLLLMDRQSKANIRLSLSQVPLTTQEMYKGILELSYKNFGDQIAHLQTAHDYLVRQQRWLSQTQFKELQELCWSLPGPTTMQVVITICILKLKSLFAGMQCFLVYNCIPWIVLTIFGLLSYYLFEGKTELMSYEMKRVFMGFNAAAAGIMVRCFTSFFVQTWYSWPKAILTLLSAAVFYLIQSIGGAILAISMSSILSLYIQVGEARGKMSIKSGDLFRNLSFNFIMGKPSLMVLVGLFFLMWIYFSIFGQNYFSYIFDFYLIGCLILGPIDAIFPFFMVVLSHFGHFDNNQIWVGLPIAFLTPGSHLNIGIYFGAMLDGVRGAFLSAIFLYLPSFLSLFGLLPQWKHYRDRQGVQRLYDGVVCSMTGLSLAMIVMVLEHWCKLDFSCTISVFILCAYMNFVMSKYSFLLILLGGAFAYLRYISVECYRYGRYCPFPFNF